MAILRLFLLRLTTNNIITNYALFYTTSTDRPVCVAITNNATVYILYKVLKNSSCVAFIILLHLEFKTFVCCFVKNMVRVL